MNRREFLAASVAGAAMLNQRVRAFGAPAGDIQVAIDAAQVGEPVNPLIFGGYFEPATTRVWAEMLTDRKFFNPVVENPPSVRNFMIPGGQNGEPFRSVGPAGTVEMDIVRPFVGKHSPRVKLDGSEPHGIQQSKLRLGRGMSYIGRVYLAGDRGAKIVVRLVWGTGATDSQSIQMPTLSSEYRNFPLHFTSPVETESARLEILGTGSGSFHVGTASLMPANNVKGYHPGRIRLYKEAGFKMAKWPGGNFVSAYDWYDGLGDPDKRPPRAEPMWGNSVESNDVGIHEFIDFCALVGAEPDLVVDSGFGEARVAAEEVQYCNGSTDTRLGKLRAANGHPEPFNVRLWTIGNEMYGRWQYGHMTLNQYCVKHNYIAEAMKKVDPAIKITSAGASVCEVSWTGAEHKQWPTDIWQEPFLESFPVKFGGANDWDGWLLTNCADNIDYMSEHTYTFPDLAFDAEKQRYVDVQDPLPLRARRLANRLGGAFGAWQKYIDTMPALKTKNIKFIFDEWGNRFRSADGRSHQAPGMVTPLSYGLFLHEIFRHSDMVGASCALQGLGTVVTDITGDAVGFTADGLVLKIMATHFAGARPIAVDGDSPQQPMIGTPFVDMGPTPTGSPTYPLDVVAAFSSDRKKVILSVINPTEESQEFTPKITGVKLRNHGKLSQIAAPSVNSANEPGKEPVIKIVEIPQGALSEKVPVLPLSVSVYEFEIENV
jgi:alpha-N-arabinofuranosidase